MRYGRNIRRGICLVALLAGAIVLGATDKFVVSFEQKEGFPSATPWPSKQFAETAVPAGIVTKWTGNAVTLLYVSDGKHEENSPAPVHGGQYAVCGFGGAGIQEVTMNLSPAHNLGLDGFHWAWRGNGDSRPGGNAYLEVEYFDRAGESAGKERFQGGLNPDWSPIFEAAKPTIQGGALSKIVFRGIPPNPDTGHGSFYLDAVNLSTRANPAAPFRVVGDDSVSAF